MNIVFLSIAKRIIERLVGGGDAYQYILHLIC